VANPVAVDLCCGLGGWTAGLLAEGYHARGYDIEAHEYDGEKYPGELVLKSILDMNGAECADAALIVASPPCTEYSYMAMPWTRAKQIGRALRGEDEFPPNYKGSRTIADLNALFDACFRIQREASEAAGREIPMVLENVNGAQPWVGRAKWSYGSYFLWGDIPALMPAPSKQHNKVKGDWFGPCEIKDAPPWAASGLKNPGFRFDGSGRSFQTESVDRHIKAPVGTRWFNGGPQTPDSLASMSSKSSARKAASACIAKIPLTLSQHIAWAHRP
jgi:hypothetical protein